MRDLKLMFPDLKDTELLQFNSHRGVLEIEKRRTVDFVYGHGGVGKTQKLFTEWNLHPETKKLYLSHTHDFLDEQSLRVKGSRHLEGLSRKCPICLDARNKFHSLIKEMYKQKFSNKNICGLCEEENIYDREDCPYKLQFEDLPKTVMAPVEYSFTKFLRDYNPDLIAVDDCLYKLNKHHTKEELERLLSLLQQITHTPEEEKIRLSTLLNLNNLDFENFLKNKLMPARRQWVNDELSYLKEHPKSEKTFLIDIDVEEFRIFKRLSNIHGLREQFATPYLFYLFDYVCNNENAYLTIIDALGQNTNNEVFMDRLTERYFKETHNGIEPYYKTVEPWKDSDSIIYRCLGKENAWYPTTSSITNSERTRRHIKECINKILETYFKDSSPVSIGLVKPKHAKAEDFFDNLHNVKSLDWGDLRGMNHLEYCDVLFVVGTYCINHQDAKENFGLTFAREPSTMNLVENRPHGGRYNYVDPDLEILRWAKEEYEQYQGIMRIRPLNHNTKIFSFGLIPQEIPEEVERGEEIQFFRKGGELEMRNRKDCLYDLLLREKGRVRQSSAVSYMAQEFGLSEKRAWQIVSGIINGDDSLRTEVERDSWGRQVIVCDKIVSGIQRFDSGLWDGKGFWESKEGQ